MGGGTRHLDTQTHLHYYPTPTLSARILDPEPDPLEETVCSPCSPSLSALLWATERQTDKHSNSSGASVLEEAGTCLSTIWLPESLFLGRKMKGR